MPELQVVVNSLIPDVYAHVGRLKGVFGRHLDMSTSGYCDDLTLELLRRLCDLGLEGTTRRELHETGRFRIGRWHYVIAHEPVDKQPDEDDIITSLNPWFNESWAPGRTGYLHGRRREVQDVMEKRGCSKLAVALHGVKTIVEAHTWEPYPRQVSNYYD